MQQPQGLVVFQKWVESATSGKDLVGELGEFKSVCSLCGYTGGENPEGQGLVERVAGVVQSADPKLVMPVRLG